MSFLRRIQLALRLTIGNRAGQGTRPIGAIVGIAIAIVPLIVVLHISDAMIAGIAERFIEAGTSHVRAAPRFRTDIDSLRRDAASIQEIDGVRYAGVERSGFALIYTGGQRTGVQLRAIDPAMYQRDSGFREYMQLESGEFVLDSDQDMVLGRSVAREIGADVGDSVRILTVRSLPGGGILPRVSTFRVRGIVSTGYQELDRLWVFSNIERGSRILPEDNSSAAINIKVEYPFGLPNELFQEGPRRADAMEAVYSRIASDYGMQYRLRSWYEAEQSRYISLESTRVALVVVMALIMAVAVVNISSSMVLLVLSKQHDIGVLKALGAVPADIRAVFLMVGAWVGVIGATVGLAVGAAVSLSINWILRGLELAARAVTALSGDSAGDAVVGGGFYLEVIPIQLLPRVLLIVWAAALLLAIVSSLLPALRAAVVRPMEVFYRR